MISDDTKKENIFDKQLDDDDDDDLLKFIDSNKNNSNEININTKKNKINEDNISEIEKKNNEGNKFNSFFSFSEEEIEEENYEEKNIGNQGIHNIIQKEGIIFGNGEPRKKIRKFDPSLYSFFRSSKKNN